MMIRDIYEYNMSYSTVVFLEEGHKRLTKEPEYDKFVDDDGTQNCDFRCRMVELFLGDLVARWLHFYRFRQIRKLLVDRESAAYRAF